MKIRLPWKLTFIFCFTIIFALSLGYFYLAANLKTYFEKNLQNNLQHQLLLSQHFLETYFAGQKNLAGADRLADKIGQDLSLRVTIIDLDGTVIGDNDLNKDALSKVENHLNRPEIRSALKEGFGISKRFSETIKQQMLYIAVPFGKHKPLGILRLAIPFQEIDLLEGKMRRIIGITIFFIFLLSLVLTFIVSLLVSKPLTEMSAIARTLAKGDFSRKLPVYSQDEIGELAHTLNYLSGEIKSAIEKVSAEKAKLDAVLSNMFEGVIVTDEEEKIILMNPSIRKLFFVDSDPEGKKPLEVIRNAAVQNIVDSILKDRQRLISKEIVVNFPEERVLKINGVPIIRNNKLEGTTLVFHDITELRQLEKVRQDFVANVSHELRTPVSSIKGYAETLLEGAIEDKANARDFLNIIYQDSNRLAKLIDDLLDLARIESGKMKMVILPLDPVALIKRSVAIVENQANSKAISIEVKLNIGLPRVLADETRFSQVMINLLDNAIKYTPEGGVIAISAGIVDKFLQIAVSDTGIGISEEDLAHLFERFYRADKARSRELGGTGLGLSIVKHIVQAHGGQVRVKSVVGQGSTFNFTIPCA